MTSKEAMLNWGGVATMSTTTFTTTSTAMEETIAISNTVMIYEAMRMQFRPSRFAL